MAREIISYQGVISDIAFRRMMIDFYYFNSIDDDILVDVKDSLFKVAIFREGIEIGNPQRKPDGVYIRIGPYASRAGVKDYVSQNWELIQSACDIYSGIKGLPKAPKLKSYTNIKRDDLIITLSALSTEELKEYTPKLRGRGIYREHRISEIAKQCHFVGVNGELVKTIIQRHRKMTNALYGKGSQSMI